MSLFICSQEDDDGLCHLSDSEMIDELPPEVITAISALGCARLTPSGLPFVELYAYSGALSPGEYDEFKASGISPDVDIFGYFDHSSGVYIETEDQYTEEDIDDMYVGGLWRN